MTKSVWEVISFGKTNPKVTVFTVKKDCNGLKTTNQPNQTNLKKIKLKEQNEIPKGDLGRAKTKQWTGPTWRAKLGGFVAGGRSARAHVAGERLRPRRSRAERSTSAHGPGTPWRLAAEPAGEGGPTASCWGDLPAWGEGLPIFYFIFFIL